MATINWQEEFEGHQDVELNVTRESHVTCRCAAPHQPDPANPYDGLVLVLHGCGQHVDDGVNFRLRNYLAEKYNLLAVGVDYHASGLNLGFDPYKQYAVSMDFYLSMVSRLSELQKGEFDSWLVKLEKRPDWVKFSDKHLDDFMSVVVQIEAIEGPQNCYLKIIAENFDHQNFGLLQSIDALTAVAKISQKYPFDTGNIIAFGSSHGGYLAHLCAKLAPNTFRGVIESSSYSYTPLYFIANRPYPGIVPVFGTVDLGRGYPLYFDTFWELPNLLEPWKTSSTHREFGYSPQAIRDLTNMDHWCESVSKSRRYCQFRMMHSSKDELFQPACDKRRHVEALRKAGFDLDYREMSEDDIDGKLVKHLEHGMGSSPRAIFDLFYPTILPTWGDLDWQLETELNFKCGAKTYKITHGKKSPKLELL